MKGTGVQMEQPGKQYAAAVTAQLRAERGARKLTFSELAEKSGVTEQSLQRYLNEKREIPVPLLIDICAGLGISVGELIQRAELRLKGEL